MTKEEQVDLFNILHDGNFVNFERNGNDLMTEVNIPYLAEIVNSEFQIFKVVFKDCSEFYLSVWSDAPNLIHDTNYISKLELEISRAKEEENCVKVACWSHKEGLGGDITFQTIDILIFDESCNQLSSEKLGRICDSYWKK